MPLPIAARSITLTDRPRDINSYAVESPAIPEPMMTTSALCFFFSGRRRHTSCLSDWSSDVCSSDLERGWVEVPVLERLTGERRAASVGERWVVSADLLASTRDELARAVAAAGRLGLDVAGLEIGRASCRERV